MADSLRCWRCGAGLEKLTLPLSRMDECPECAVHLHVCHMCINFDPAVTGSCREDAAEEVLEKERANFCDFFVLRGSSGAKRNRVKDAKSALEALFKK